MGTKNISIKDRVIKTNCCICGKEFELSYNQKYSYIKKNKRDFVCSKECKAKLNSIKFTKEKPIKKCYICGKEFRLSNDQFTKFNKNPNDKFFCSQSCIAKYSNRHINKESRTLKIQELSKDIKWNESKQNKRKETCLEKYGCDNVYKSEIIKNKIKQTKEERYGDSYYNNREKFKETWNNKSKQELEKYSKLRSNQLKEIISNRSDEEKLNINTKISKTTKYNWNNISDEDKATRRLSFSKGQIKRWEKMSKEERQKIMNKTFHTTEQKYGTKFILTLPDIQQRARKNNEFTISKTNKKIKDILEAKLNKVVQLEVETFDLKIDNYVIEVNPIFSHCSDYSYAYMTRKSEENKPIPKNYHWNKTLLAKEKGYRCIHLWDWDDINKIIMLLENKTPLYARKLKVQLVDEVDCNLFLDKYHIQNSCRNQTIRLGLYDNETLIQIMTFGKPRYNKNYQYELLRLCTKEGYKIIGGAEKLFNYFLNNYNPKSIISYCDNSKFNGDVYLRLNFKLKSYGSPTKHWNKGCQQITDNLLRQRGYDQLFGTNYGKGTSNEKLMLENNWLPIYDCGQSTYIWTKS